MRRTSKLLALGMTVVFLISALGVAVSPARAGIGDLLKGAALAVLVDSFSGELNKFINTLTFNKGVGATEKTKVVPILSVGQSGYVGAAQVTGPAALVDKVKAVAQLEANMSGKTFRIKVLIPVESKDVIKDLKRVGGVGASAVIDVKI